jgi:ABC-type uncharacterized transport system ATPase component
MAQALRVGDRTVMFHRGEIVFDVFERQTPGDDGFGPSCAMLG